MPKCEQCGYESETEVTKVIYKRQPHNFCINPTDCVKRIYDNIRIDKFNKS